jgi:hypothetical protein
MKNNISIFLVSSIFLSSHAMASEDVYLECQGVETSCYITTWGEKVCQAPVDVYHPIKWSGTSIKHLNNYATLEFKDKCLVSKSDIKCYEENGSSKFGELIGGNVRTLTLSRFSGRVDYSSASERPDAASVKFGATHDVITYSGKCYPRTSQYLF